MNEKVNEQIALFGFYKAEGRFFIAADCCELYN